jgi:Zn-dependent protease
MVRAMDEDRWSFLLIRVRGFPIRVHVFFLIFAALTLLSAFFVQDEPLGSAAPGYALLLLVVLAGSVLLHELGHLLASWYWGGHWRSAVITPFGGLGRFDPPLWPHHEMAVYLAGPAVHAALSATAGLILLASGHWNASLLHPLMPVGLLEGPVTLVILQLITWTNWVLCLLNVLPIFTGDGIRILSAFILYAFPSLPKQQATRRVVHVSRTIGAVLLVVLLFQCGLVFFKFPGLYHTGPWFALMLLALINFCMGEQLYEELREQLPSVPSSDIPEKQNRHADSPAATLHASTLQEKASVIPSPPREPLSETTAGNHPQPCVHSDTVRMVSRETERILKVRERERLELMDELLARIAREGIQSLSEEELEFLRRCSKSLPSTQR